MRTQITILFLAITVSLEPLSAQPRPVTLTVVTAGLLPTGLYASDLGERPEITRRFGFDFGSDVGLARPGVGFGVELESPIRESDFSWMLSARFLTNPTDESRVERTFRHELGDTVDLRFDYGSWMHVPVFAGIRYGVKVADELEVHGIIQAGVNVTRQAPRVVRLSGQIIEETTFKTIPDFGFELGFGVRVLDRYSLSLRYLDLGAPRYEGNRRLSESFFPTIPYRVMSVDGDRRPVSIVVVQAGIGL